MNQKFKILWFCKTSVQNDLMKIYPLHIPQSGVVQTQGIQAGTQSHLVHRFDGRFKGTLRGFTYLLVFLLNTSLHVTQDIIIIVKELHLLINELKIFLQYYFNVLQNQIIKIIFLHWILYDLWLVIKEFIFNFD